MSRCVKKKERERERETSLVTRRYVWRYKRAREKEYTGASNKSGRESPPRLSTFSPTRSLPFSRAAPSFASYKLPLVPPSRLSPPFLSPRRGSYRVNKHILHFIAATYNALTDVVSDNAAVPRTLSFSLFPPPFHPHPLATRAGSIREYDA